MGYTHYWTFKNERGNAQKIEQNYQRAIKKCQKIVRTYAKKHGGIAGYSAHTTQYGGLNFNGSRENGHETFVVREHFSQNFTDGRGFSFCKTAQKPYDVLVVACLIILKHYLGKNIDVASDGDKIDWVHGLELARAITGLKTLKIPDSIRDGQLRLAR